ncbi:hypothetical protein APHAL10511_002047 [Amanita phalloides]|nr:hypothetical protein APHAL10511_002047 [Amanita phalloides]
MPPKTYDSTSVQETHISLPSSPQINVNRDVLIQPPLTRRGTGPGLIVFQPDPSKLEPGTKAKALDPDPVQKWAEEGFAVSGVTISDPEPNFIQILQSCCETLSSLDQVEPKEIFAVLIHDYLNAFSILSAVDQINQMPGLNLRVVCIVIYGYTPLSPPSIPTLLHLHSGSASQMSGLNFVVHCYESTSPYFIFPQTNGYDPGAATIAHTRTLTFLRKSLGGPIFDLEAIWEEHVRFEFEVRSVAKTMSTMVVRILIFIAH